MSMEETSLSVDALAGFDVVEVVEEAVVVGELVGVEAEGGADLVEDLGVGEVPALVGDAEGGEAEAGGGDGGHAARVERCRLALVAAARSRTWPVVGLACSTKKRQARRCRSSRKASSSGVRM